MTREEAANMIKNDIYLHHDYLSGEYRKALKVAISALEQPERKTGKWLDIKLFGISCIKCSECNFTEMDMPEARSKFCPECGCKMEVEHD